MRFDVNRDAANGLSIRFYNHSYPSAGAGSTHPCAELFTKTDYVILLATLFYGENVTRFNHLSTKEREMPTKLVIGLDGSGSGDRAVAYAKKMAKLIGSCELIIVYVIEWSPYSFQTAEENAKRHARREEEISSAFNRMVDPAVMALNADGFQARGVVKHGDVADLLNAVAVEERADQIIVARSSEHGFVKRMFGSSTANLVMDSSVPVTVVV